MARVAIFAGLVVDAYDNPVEVDYIANAPNYVVDDAGFLRHIPSEYVDRQVLKVMQEQVVENREAVVDGMMEFLGQDDLFTKATVEASINQMDENIEQLFQVGLPEETRTWMGMIGFRVVIDVHGDVVDVQMPDIVDLGE